MESRVSSVVRGERLPLISHRTYCPFLVVAVALERKSPKALNEWLDPGVGARQAAWWAFGIFIGVLLCILWVCRRTIKDWYREARATTERKRTERAYGRDHPLTITTLGGDKYIVPDWAMCKDLRAALAKVAPELGNPSTFLLLGSNSTDGLAAHQLDPLYGSEDRTQMLAGEITTELSLVMGGLVDEHGINTTCKLARKEAKSLAGVEAGAATETWENPFASFPSRVVSVEQKSSV